MPPAEVHHAAVGQADQRVVRQRAAVGVELLAGLQDDGVHPALGVGQLHPVAGAERPAGAPGTGSRPTAVVRRSVTSSRSAGCAAVTAFVSGAVRAPGPGPRRAARRPHPRLTVTTYCAPGWAWTAADHLLAGRGRAAARQRVQRSGHRVDRHPGSPVHRHRVRGRRVDQRDQPAGASRPRRARRRAGPCAARRRCASASGVPVGTAKHRAGQPAAGRPAGTAAAHPGQPDRLAGAPPQRERHQQHEQQRRTAPGSGCTVEQHDQPRRCRPRRPGRPSRPPRWPGCRSRSAAHTTARSARPPSSGRPGSTLNTATRTLLAASWKASWSADGAVGQRQRGGRGERRRAPATPPGRPARPAASTRGLGASRSISV